MFPVELLKKLQAPEELLLALDVWIVVHVHGFHIKHRCAA